MRAETKDYASRIREQFVAGNDYAVWTIIQELNEDQELFLEVWACL